MKKIIWLLLGLTFVFVGFSNDNHNSQGIILDAMNSRAVDYDSLEELVRASDLIIEARVLDHPEVVDQEHYPITTISNLYVEDILFARNGLDRREIKLIERGDYRYHVDIVQSRDKHILFLKRVDRFGELLQLVNDSQSLLGAAYVATDQWMGKFNITNEKTTIFYAGRDRVKPFQEELSSLPHHQMKEKIRGAIAEVWEG